MNPYIHHRGVLSPNDQGSLVDLGCGYGVHVAVVMYIYLDGRNMGFAPYGTFLKRMTVAMSNGVFQLQEAGVLQACEGEEGAQCGKGDGGDGARQAKSGGANI
ncbi:hypothetical protein GOP47_0030312 [Adiantum capillus-veneris]|nr:hypothetical protein GOP47_0030312 [Adiantum capillus-veneris]